MKHLLFIGVLLLMIPMTAQSGPPPAKKLTVVVNGLDGEAYHTRALNFQNVFRRTDGTQFGTSVYEQVSLAALHTMETEALNKDAAQTDSFFHVLRVFYGYDATAGTIKLIYVPDYAIKDATDPGGLTYKFQNGMPPFPAGTLVYTTNAGNGFDRIPWQGAAEQLFTNYISGSFVQLNAYGNPDAAPTVWRPLGFDPTPSEASNHTMAAEVSTFSFQELNTFLEGGGVVYVTNIPEVADFHGINTYKHAIAFSKTPPSETNGTSVVANLGSLCPTVCGTVQLRTIPTCREPAMMAAYFVPPPPPDLTLKTILKFIIHDPISIGLGIALILVCMGIGARIQKHWSSDQKLQP